MIKPWAFEFFPASQELEADPEAARGKIDYFQFFLDLWVRAEALGFEGVFLSEHHFGSAYSPSPNLLLPLIAQRTKTLRVGVMGMVASYHNAWRLVEEIGMLDVLTGGRLEVGTSAGIPGEFAAIGMSTQEARARYDEAVQIIDAGLKQGTISHKGQYWNFENITLAPRPLQRPHPPLWTTVVSVESAKKAARRGSKIATAFISVDQARQIFEAYNEEADKAGNPSGPEQVALRRQIAIDPDPAGLSDRWSRGVEAFRQRLAGYDNRVVAPGRQSLDQPGAHSFAVSDDEFIHGSPADVAERALAQCAATGAGHFQALFREHQTLHELAHSWELFGQEVIPVLRKAGGGEAGASSPAGANAEPAIPAA